MSHQYHVNFLLSLEKNLKMQMNSLKIKEMIGVLSDSSLLFVLKETIKNIRNKLNDDKNYVRQENNKIKL